MDWTGRWTVTDAGCWEWNGGRNKWGYGKFRQLVTSPGVCHACGQDLPPPRGKTVQAHRAVYEDLVGPIPVGLFLDHLCRNKACVNPDHLEPVTAQENARRAKAHITHCPQGHPYDDANTYWHKGRRGCKICRKDAAMRFKANNPERMREIDRAYKDRQRRIG